LSANLVNATELRVLAMRRSGHHAVIHWLLRQLRGPGLFLNDCKLDDGGEGERGAALLGNRFSRYVNLSEEDAGRDRAGDLVPKELLVFNFEDLSVGEFAACLARVGGRGASGRVRHLIVVRDPFNWVASRLQTLPTPALARSALLETWKGHVRECLRRTEVLPDLVPVDFRRWVGEAGYRRKLARELGLPFDDTGFREVVLPGLSSFDSEGVAADNTVVLDRWRECAGDPGYRAVFDPEVIELAEAFFGFNPLA
jgi:hypothetical protein